MKILLSTSEATPLIKTGGLADVAGSLPVALRSLGHDCRIILPAYPEAIENSDGLEKVAELALPGHNQDARLLSGTAGPHKTPIYLVDAPRLFDRPGNPYLSPEGFNWPDNADRFGLFCRAAVHVTMDRCGLAWKPDILHANDWQTGLIAPLLQKTPNRPATIFTIHNLAYQGLFDWHDFERLQLPEELWSMQGVEFYDQFSFIKGGIAYSDQVNTVSPTYAEEVKTLTYGAGLDGLLNYRSDDFCGILNGIDYQIWDPEQDPFITSKYTADRFESKLLNKLALQREFGLPENDSIQLFGYIGRLVDQKGVDLILQVLPGIMDSGAQIVFLGSGNSDLERSLLKLSNKYHTRVGVRIGYDEELSHRIEAGADCFLMPSRFEPCGLNQMYSLRYGTVPIVRNTGGLADTVIDVGAASLSNGSATGFVFDQPDGESLWRAVERAIEFYHRPDVAWQILAMTGMQQDFSWEASAKHYMALYESALQCMTV
ncbi:MAG: glycogen synthase GlgA [Gammaproteobacteria bacterium]|nr:glycogen synthase GlgA [Gammaproteobacteria bacterium]